MRPAISFLLAALALASAPLAAQTGPDVIGIRPGMSAQEAYTALKAHANGAKVGVAQTRIAGIDQPVVVLMTEQVLGASPAEVITVWLTFPPQKQVVWAIRRTLRFEHGKEPTHDVIMAGLRQKYGPEIHAGVDFWDFDEQGGRPNVKDMTFNHCAGMFNLAEPQDLVNPQPITPLVSGYLPPKPTPCTDLTVVRTEWYQSFNDPNELATGITVMLEDTAIARRSREAYQTLLNNAANAAHQQEIDNASRQKKPAF